MYVQYQKKPEALDPLELELRAVVNCYLGAGTQPGPLQEQSVLLTLIHLSIPKIKQQQEQNNLKIF
jgi:hypothetical protein